MDTLPWFLDTTTCERVRYHGVHGCLAYWFVAMLLVDLNSGNAGAADGRLMRREEDRIVIAPIPHQGLLAALAMLSALGKTIPEVDSDNLALEGCQEGY